MTATAPEGVAIRPAERADLLDVFRIERASFPQPWPYGAFEGFLGEPGFLVAVGPPDDGGDPPAIGGPPLETGEPVHGFVVADVYETGGRPIGHVKDLAVATACRGRGIGSRLLGRALAVLRARGARRVRLEVRVDNRAARELYEGFGFSRDHVVPSYYDDGADALVLVADLAEGGGG